MAAIAHIDFAEPRATRFSARAVIAWLIDRERRFADRARLAETAPQHLADMGLSPRDLRDMGIAAHAADPAWQSWR
ncbi:MULTISPECIES: hypothetical protein [unclassified Roseitalea]|uniref:hypothetical protein n=1 Tax=unclassified Roseitalea TaxID=2639107 RepID=UPI00273DAE28|nr:MULTISPECIES: hypothetical protein [unclassified Roseitalea]